MGELVPLETLQGMRRRRKRRNARKVAGALAAFAFLAGGFTGGMMAAHSKKFDLALAWFAGTPIVPPTAHRLIAGRDSK